MPDQLEVWGSSVVSNNRKPLGRRGNMQRSMGITRSKFSRKFVSNTRNSQEPMRAACTNAIEQLEKRLLFTTVVVTNTLASGTGSLNDAILAVNSSTDQANTIQFNLASDGSVQSIPVASALPAL